MKILFIKPSQNFPRSSGHDVHGYGMMKALIERGHQVGLLTKKPVADEAKAGLNLCLCSTLSELSGESPNSIPFLQKKFTSYWGVEDSDSAKINYLVEEHNFDAVVVVGLGVLPYLSQIRGAKRIWYAADEWFLHHWSLVKLSKPSSWKELKVGLIKGIYERAFRSCTDAVWVVSQKDAQFIRHVMGVRNVAVTPNGVDVDHFAPLNSPKLPNSFVFWGRLDFQPNIDAIEWFGKNVFLPYKNKVADTTWTVYGFNASPDVKAFQKQFGFELLENLPDLRTELAKHHLAVMPFVSGAGIKNKLLEAAAMGMPILASPVALNGLDSSPASIHIAKSPSEWIDLSATIHGSTPDAKLDARQWVLEKYSWDSAARIAEDSIS